MYILGISAFYHDSAAVLLKDGRIAAAAQEERFSRIKNDSGYPREAIAFCLRHAGIDIKDVAYVVFYEKTLLKFDRLLETYLALAPNCWSSFSHAIPLWLHEKLFIKRKILRELGREFSGKIVFPSHHESHAASAFFPSPFERAAILTVDGVGEWATASIGQGSGNQIRLLEELAFPHSVGLLYSAFTYFTGFRVNSGEYKLMGLAPYGRGRFADLIREKLVRIFPDGSIRLNMEYFDFCGGLTMTNRKFAALFGGPPRRPETPITQREMDLAASIQIVTEEIILNMAHHARELTGERNLVMAGGVALNCVCNGKLRESGMFDDIWIQPAAGDAGGALGAAMFLHYQLLEKERPVSGHDAQQGSFLGPEYTKEQIAAAIRQAGAEAVFYESEADWLHRTAEELASGNVVGWFQGRMEFGPRALGGRSILADPRDKAMQTRLNLKIKFTLTHRIKFKFLRCVAGIFRAGNIDVSFFLLVVEIVNPQLGMARFIFEVGPLARFRFPRTFLIYNTDLLRQKELKNDRRINLLPRMTCADLPDGRNDFLLRCVANVHRHSSDLDLTFRQWSAEKIDCRQLFRLSGWHKRHPRVIAETQPLLMETTVIF